MTNKSYDVTIDRDRYDKFDGGDIHRVESDVTYGRLTLDGVEVRWEINIIEPIVDDEPKEWGGRFDLVIDWSRDFRSRADAVSIYDAVVDALQERHHPERCECRECDDDYDENRRLDQKADLEELGEPARQELRGLGLIESEPVFVADDREITLDDVLGPGATEAQGLRTELEESGLMKKDTRRSSTRCDEHDEHEQENT